MLRARSSVFGDGLEKAVKCDRPNTSYLRLPRQPETAYGATTPGFSGPCPSHSGVFWAPAHFRIDAVHAGLRVLLVWQLPKSLSLRDASPGSESSPLGRLSGRRPFARSAIARSR